MEERHVQAFEAIVQQEFNRTDNRRLRVASPPVGCCQRTVLFEGTSCGAPAKPVFFVPRCQAEASLQNESLVMKLKTLVCVNFASS
jgi:hypothetical protein